MKPVRSDGEKGNQFRKLLSVLTEHLIDEPGQPTCEALDQVLDHLRARLLPTRS